MIARTISAPELVPGDTIISPHDREHLYLIRTKPGAVNSFGEFAVGVKVLHTGNPGAITQRYFRTDQMLMVIR